MLSKAAVPASPAASINQVSTSILDTPAVHQFTQNLINQAFPREIFHITDLDPEKVDHVNIRPPSFFEDGRSERHVQDLVEVGRVWGVTQESFLKDVDPVPLVETDFGKYKQIGGFHRLEWARRQGFTKIPVMIIKSSLFPKGYTWQLAAHMLNIRSKPKKEHDRYDHQHFYTFNDEYVEEELTDYLSTYRAYSKNMLTRIAEDSKTRKLNIARISTDPAYGKDATIVRWQSKTGKAIINKLSDDFDRSMDFPAAVKYLREMGVDYDDRDIDSGKGFGSSITLDLTASTGPETLQHVSIRGTVTEGVLMISRINDFHGLYFEPKGNTVVFVYKDRPGVLARISAALAAASVNIDDVRNPHDSKGEKSIAIIKVNQVVQADVIAKIAKDIEATTHFCVEL